MQEPEYNLDEFKEMMGNDEAEILNMISMFIELTPNLLGEMNHSLSSKDYKKVGDLAHKVKSSLRIMGMNELTELSVEIEKDGRNNQNLVQLGLKVEIFTKRLKAIIEKMKKDYNLN